VSGLRLPLALSIAGHAIGLALLVWLSARLPPLVLLPPAPPNAVAVIFEAPPAPPQPAPTPPPPPPPAKVEPPPPPPPLPKPVEVPKPVIHEPPKPRHIVHRRIERPVRREEMERPPTPPVAAPQTAALPPAYHPPPAPLISLDYRNMLAEWFAAHKHYPESARERGEEGEGVLRFRVDRAGRVLSYALVRSTGYADLDGAIEAMMQGAVLPPFPSDMAANDIEVTMPFSFRLEQ
jgi:periplasmic protein TonB